MRYLVDPRRVQKVQMKDGTQYPVGRDGHVVITRGDHRAEMDRCGEDGAGHATTFGGQGLPCPCGHVAWPWQRECPRCGQVLGSA